MFDGIDFCDFDGVLYFLRLGNVLLRVEGISPVEGSVGFQLSLFLDKLSIILSIKHRSGYN